MSVVLSKHLSLLASAPDGIQKLRGLILELAARGKLVPQDPKDEPASELLKKIAKERARLEAEGTCKKMKATPLEESEWPFDLPIGWEWCRFPDVANYKMGKTPPTKEAAYWADAGIPWVSISDMSHGQLIAKTSRTVSNAAREKVFRSAPAPAGTLLMSFKLTVGKVATLGLDAFHNEAIVSIFPFEGLSQEFLSHFLPMIAKGGNSKSALMGDTLNSESLALLCIPLPPLAEQHRIVAKVDELMALCDRLDAEQTGAEAAHAKLVETLLGTLTQSTDAAELAANWQRLAEHFDTLFDAPYAVALLRRAILELAAVGLLVTRSRQPELCALSELIEGNSLNGSSKKPSDEPGGIQILRISAGTGNDDFFVDETDHKWIDATTAEIEKFRLLPGDLLACRFNGNLHYVGSFSLYQGSSGHTQVFPDKLIRFRVRREKVLPHYLRYSLNSASVRVQIESFCATTVGNIGISATNLKTVKVRVPELDEQHRIVAKVDELMALCDRIKADLAESRIRQARLSATLIESALQAA